MPTKTSIEWTDFSSNLLKYDDEYGRTVWHCEKVSPGCKNCYAGAMARRFKRGLFIKSNTSRVTPFFDQSEADKIQRNPEKWAGRMFIDDMTDLFGDWVPEQIIDQHFIHFSRCPLTTFQVLTKRPERMRDYLSNLTAYDLLRWDRLGHRTVDDWPLANVWLGTSVEDQKAADERIPHLLQCPAAVQFLSCEPMLGTIDLNLVPHPEGGELIQHGCLRCPACGYTENDKRTLMDHSLCSNPGDTIDWVIVGGESGPGARPCEVSWIEDALEQCREAGVAAFVKQLGSNVVGMKLKHGKGADMSEWPESLRVREFPA